MLDLTLNILLGLFVTILTVWGGIVSAKSLPLGEKKSTHIWGFILCGTIAFLLTVFIGFRSHYAQRDSERQQKGLADSLKQTSESLNQEYALLEQSRFSEEFMKGQLNGLGMLVGRLNSDGTSASANLARAIRQIGEGFVHGTGIEPPAIQKMTGSQLRQRVIDFAQQMHKYASDFVVGTAKLVQTTNNMRNRNTALSDEQKRQGENGVIQGRSYLFQREFQETYLGDATEYKDELLRRLGPQKPMTWSQQSELIWGNESDTFITPASAMASAEYLDGLARQLPQ